VFALLVKHGHDPYDIKYKYTIDQVNLFYKYAIEDDLTNHRMATIGMAKANSLYAQYGSKKDASAAYNSFMEYIDSLDPKKLEDKRKRDAETAKNPMGVFNKLFRGMIVGA